MSRLGLYIRKMGSGSGNKVFTLMGKNLIKGRKRKYCISVA
jgi:hypothetical protein